MRTIVVCLLISSFFWLAQKFNREYETKLEVPVRFETSENISAIGNVPKTIIANVKSSGWMLFIHNISFLFSPLIVKVTPPTTSEKNQGFENEITEALIERLFEVQFNGLEASKYSFTFSEIIQKDIFLKIDLSKIEVSQSCKIINSSLRPENIVVSGTREELKYIPDTLKIPLEVPLLEKTFTKQINIDNIKPNSESKSFSVFARIEVECLE